MALFVFGAGATRGCSFVDSTKNPCLPFLDSDFFTQLQKVSCKKHQEHIKAVMKDIVELFGYNFNVTMESVFSNLEQMIAMLGVRGKEPRGLKTAELKQKQGRLKQAIAIVLEEALASSEGQAQQEPIDCENHKKFVEGILKKKDSILSFNYDCVLDYALKKYGDGKWNPKFGYGFKLVPASTNLKHYDKWQPNNNVAQRNDTVYLYKLHGSLHFLIKDTDDDKSEIILKERPYTKQKGSQRFTIIPPEWHKKYDKGVFAHLWRKAGSAIASAEHIVIIGYSFPASDLHSSSLFLTSIKHNLKSIVVVNPDREARKRARTILQRGLSPDTRVISIDTFKDFIAVSRDVWDAQETVPAPIESTTNTEGQNTNEQAKT
jgi:hypothetical protein